VLNCFLIDFSRAAECFKLHKETLCGNEGSGGIIANIVQRGSTKTKIAGVRFIRSLLDREVIAASDLASNARGLL
jgi:hypothetical protein